MRPTRSFGAHRLVPSSGPRCPSWSVQFQFCLYSDRANDASPVSCGSDPVPMIDLEDPDAMMHVGHACRTWGVFQVMNHGVPMMVLDDMEASGRKLFSLPVHQKLQAARPLDGVSGYGVAPISSFFPKLMWSEGFTIVGSAYEHAQKLWPQGYTHFCEVIEEYKKEMNKLVKREGAGWVTVPPIRGALVVNVGDLLHILSNGLYSSVLHRAMVNRTQHRLSVAYLYGPPSKVRISPLSKLTDSFHPPLYRPVTWSEYLGTKAKHFNNALSIVRLCAQMNGFVDVNDHNGVLVG
ncbi:hypothetical protein E3N88_09965 [Mikania micrantha]|uniref:Fe2OG dioxygenase domain-containing protein n=1 Tax=Mikania micrantha TaxID=192012 RepID=A0A5N6PB45_9ASTR|nr:hypothetical protein E3N88_09965 [Mikania micrantha]